MRCIAEKKRGRQCEHLAVPGSQFCHMHAAAKANGQAGAASSTAGTATVASAPCADATAGEAGEPDPFQTIADAMSRVAEETQDFGEESDVVGGTGQSRQRNSGLGKAVYATSYYVGYSVAFPTFLALGMLPMNNPLGRGLRDGARSAKQSVRQRK